ncbi:hypothetical protein [Nocardioides sp. InS609-2]|uniref:hypothetical protein n=1 Tax=Nocardioides sp. InS609-2 TaxID=2760705 RepID=UPI0017992F76|nr:hypothetical protein [Nocardioides sp. InS609-2]MBA3781844.1 hypothetical protein [Nocardioides sp.]
MVRRVFIHLGLPKTGTTYLQTALWSNKDRLRRAGVLVPGPRHRRHLLASLDIRQDPRLARRAGNIKAPWQDLVDETRDFGGDAVISHEFFGAAAPEHVQRMVDSFPGAELHAIVTARPLTELVASRWQEWIKNGGTMAIDDWPVRYAYDPTNEWGWGSFDLHDILKRWSQVLPREQVHILPVDPASETPDDLWRRFCDVLGVDAAGFPAPADVANPSLGVVEVELLRRVTPHLTDFLTAGDRGRWVRGYLAEGGVLPESGERFRAGEEAFEKQHRKRADKAVELIAEGGFDVRGDAGLLAPQPLPDLRHPSEVTDAELVESAAQTIAAMLEDVRSISRERDELRRQLAEEEGLDASTVASADEEESASWVRLSRSLNRLRRHGE